MGRKITVRKTPTETVVVYRMGKKAEKIKLAPKWKPHWFYERIVPISLLLGVGSMFMGIGLVRFAEAFGKDPIIKEVPTLVEVQPSIPILDKIAKCESGGNQFDKNGKVIKGKVNKADSGKYQINTNIWGKKAKELGFDLNTLQGNEAMAKWIFFHKGSVPWVNSSKCWNK